MTNESKLDLTDSTKNDMEASCGVLEQLSHCLSSSLGSRDCHKRAECELAPKGKAAHQLEVVGKSSASDEIQSGLTSDFFHEIWVRYHLLPIVKAI